MKQHTKERLSLIFVSILILSIGFVASEVSIHFGASIGIMSLGLMLLLSILVVLYIEDKLGDGNEGEN